MFMSLGCDSECPNCGPQLPPNCTSFQDIRESECLGEVFSKLCSGFFCGDAGVGIPAIFNCTKIDCSTVECGDVVFNLHYDDVKGLTATVNQDGVNLGNAECGFIQN